MSWVIGVDVGGTFTDFYACDDRSGRRLVHKTPSTPEQPARAIIAGLRTLCAEGDIDMGTIHRIAHGTTIATNTLIQRRGAKVALITTQGFRDLLEVGRQARSPGVGFREDHPATLVPRDRRFEVAERVTASGEVLHPLRLDSLEAAVAQVRDSGAEACAVCLLFSFLNPAHEQLVARALSAIPGLYVSLSSEVQPACREYERLATTVLNAYLQPAIARHLGELEGELAQRLPAAVIGVNQSSGGLMSIEQARRFPIRTAFSGPAAGVVGAILSARLAGRPDVITLDMGGTSAEVALVREYEVGSGRSRQVGGFPLRLPMVDVNAIGAGGGSIAWFDRHGLLQVGPLSAGASPGPACYSAGGDQPTVTDANLILGRLSPAGLLGGKMPLDVAAARAAFAPLAGRLGCSIERAAHRVLGIAASHMVQAIRALSSERGHDPRRFALMAFGGAGPLHASDVARSLGIQEVIVPPAPGILGAHGLVVSDLKEEFVHTARTRVDERHVAHIRDHLQALLRAGQAWLAAEKLPPERCVMQVTLDMRSVAQEIELAVPFPVDALIRLSAAEAVTHLRTRFFDMHEATYGYHDPDEPVEIVNYRLTARGRLYDAPEVAAAAGMSHAPEPVGRRLVYFHADVPQQTPVYDRVSLGPGHALVGPAVIDQLDATTLLFPGEKMRVDEALNLIVEVA